MKKFNVSCVSAALLLCFSGSSFAEKSAVNDDPETENSQVSVTWQSPDDYRDVRPTNQSRTRFQEQTFNRLEAHFAEMAEALPEGQMLEVTVTDVDLAGQVWPSSFVGLGSGAEDVRIIKDIDIPRMSFSYQLKENGLVIKESDVDLKDMGFLHTSLRGSDSETLRYEKRMLDDWFKKEFSDQIAKQ
ncbi:DUF3016 domain-containing protein [Alteromonas oceanisediminis]|uniref:DUF3016 domain-containing protein n=1 Tax=Alteromonas oceanisediminis TaxID=2836180 RepID=UPI001BD9AC00|nr:DUF3016 domain-containing protein [Alteromonas oceanisediminis]MBT0585318.1 DUF3016 domain-containing protein [Alteromonas oceanisediminis]